ncbi:hypothetical protein SCP_0706180 [Sparassis crispa]|uniref:Uncharacterized protein n=1 Tax=Sparassis crispa TaxID=139825 RepID=A0A401GT66_9APHY|nr:hypothetical protein SCP_0706180 [Sparassis crispa]GBE85431.1 hypothetical protein SCP_0706180 [Sparassis crispa]
MALKINFNNFGFIVGLLGLIALLPPLVAVVMYVLPSRRQRDLDDVLCNTESLWRTTREEGLFQGSPFVEMTEHKLAHFRTRATDLRMDTYRATNIFQDMRGILTGLSLDIALLCRRVKNLRATISTTTTEERKKLQNEHLYTLSAEVYSSETNSPLRALAAGTYPSTNVAPNSQLFVTERAAPSSTSCSADLTPRSGLARGAPTDIESSPSLDENTSIESSSECSTLPGSRNSNVDLGRRCSAEVDAEEIQAQTLETDYGLIPQQLCIPPNSRDGTIHIKPAFLIGTQAAIYLAPSAASSQPSTRSFVVFSMI